MATEIGIKSMEYKPILNKRQFVKEYMKGTFGNRSPTWDNISEFLEHDRGPGPFHIRNRIRSAHTWYDIAGRNVPAVWEAALRAGYDPKDLYISQMAPTSKTLIQGEIQQTPAGIALFHTCVALPMREALAVNSHQDYGIIALETLRHFMCVNSYEWMETLLDRYPGHVLEFSTYSCNFGTVPGRNTVWWECRLY